jgi:hypothetical protein
MEKIVTDHRPADFAAELEKLGVPAPWHLHYLDDHMAIW